jgi:hypothetical protein
VPFSSSVKQPKIDPEDEGTTVLRNVESQSPNDKVSYLTRLVASRL